MSAPKPKSPMHQGAACPPLCSHICSFCISWVIFLPDWLFLDNEGVKIQAEVCRELGDEGGFAGLRIHFLIQQQKRPCFGWRCRVGGEAVEGTGTENRLSWFLRCSWTWPWPWLLHCYFPLDPVGYKFQMLPSSPLSTKESYDA